jgi:hypothetical protein
MRYSVMGLTYQDALKLVAELNEYGISSNITVGGIAIYVNEDKDQLGLLEKICKKFNTVAEHGNTIQEDIVYFRKSKNYDEE